MVRPSSLPLIAVVLALVLIDLLGLFAESPGRQVMTVLAQGSEAPYTTPVRVGEPSEPSSVLLELARRLVAAVDNGEQGTVSRLLAGQPLPLP